MEDVENEERSVYGFKTSMTVTLESDTRVTADSLGRKQRMRVPHRSMKVVVGLLQEFGLSGLL